MELTAEQEKIVYAKEDKVVVVSSAGSGKAQPNSTMIPTPTGYRNIGSLKIGDQVFGRAGAPETITGVYPQGSKQVYRVMFESGRATECCAEHLWSVYHNDTDELETLTTNEIIARGVIEDYHYCFSVPCLTRPINWSLVAMPQVDFYGLGATNFDANFAYEQIAMMAPDARCAFLRGVFDKNSTLVHHSGYLRYTSRIKRSARAIAEIARSLGIYCQEAYVNSDFVVMLRPSSDAAARILSEGDKQKALLEMTQSQYYFVPDRDKIVAITALDEYEEMTCIMVDDDEHLYLTNDYIITHNTTCLVERFRHFLQIGYEPSHMVLITFTNAAAEEIADRLGNPKGPFIGTVHAYANFLLRCVGIDTNEVIDDENFDELFEMVKRRPECARYVEMLMLDEGQDSTPQQFEFLFKFVCPRQWTIFCDWRQSIYRFAGADPQILIDLSKDKSVATYSLKTNFRCADTILEFAQRRLLRAGKDYKDNSVCGNDFEGIVEQQEYSLLGVGEIIGNIRKDYGKWFILVRTNAQLEEIRKILIRMKIPYTTFRRAEIDTLEFNRLMAANTVKLLTIHSSKGLENDNVIVIGARAFSVEEKCISYVAATRARHKLYWFWTTAIPRIEQEVIKNLTLEKKSSIINIEKETKEIDNGVQETT